MTRVVLVHERFTERAGSEKVVEEFGRIWPDARIFAPIADPAVWTPGGRVIGGPTIATADAQPRFKSVGEVSPYLRFADAPA